MNVAFFASEVFPFAKTGGLADVCGSLPIALEEIGIKSCIFMPRYSCVDEKKYSLTRVNAGIVKTAIGKDVDVYFIENNDYFNRDGLYGDKNGDYPDNLERFRYFCRMGVEAIKGLGLSIDIVHCHDWQSALIPVYLKEIYGDDSKLNKIKTVLTVHNLAFQGVFPKKDYPKLRLKAGLFNAKGFEFYDQLNLLKGGLNYADAITTVSERYAQEIQTQEFGCGLDDVLRLRKKDVSGIINGLDLDVWNPKTDQYISRPYDASDYQEGKAANKKSLQKLLGLPQEPQVPLFGFVGRITHQKGVDLIAEALCELKSWNMQVAIQGTGDVKYHDALLKLVKEHPKQLALYLEYSEEMAHHIFAGSDFFLLPSTFEPCGLSQMISMRFGTIPIAFKTGGLADTIDDQKNGILFETYSKEALGEALQSAQEMFAKKDKLSSMINHAFEKDFSWKSSAKAYKDIYTCLLSE